jgi:hypothetical protein
MESGWNMLILEPRRGRGGGFALFEALSDLLIINDVLTRNEGLSGIPCMA